MIIAIAEIDDLERVVELIMHLDKEYGFGDFPRAKEGCVRKTVYHNYHNAPCFLVKDGDNIVGFSSLAICDYGWSDETCITPFITYVLKKHRNIDIVKKLYKTIKDYAKLQGALLIDTHLAMERVDGRRRLLRSQGFKESGFLLTYKG